MKELVLAPPVFGFVVGTRAMFGFGVGLLVASRIPDARRRTIGTVLAALGAVSTIPAVMLVFRRSRNARRQGA
jgi:hypothetical protein